MSIDPNRPRPSRDLVYSEADLYEQKAEWERTTRENQVSTQLATLSGQLTSLIAGLPGQIEQVAKRVVVEVLVEEEKKRAAIADRKWTRADVVGTLLQSAIAILMAYLVLRPH